MPCYSSRHIILYFSTASLNPPALLCIPVPGFGFGGFFLLLFYIDYIQPSSSSSRLLFRLVIPFLFSLAHPSHTHSLRPVLGARTELLGEPGRECLDGEAASVGGVDVVVLAGVGGVVVPERDEP